MGCSEAFFKEALKHVMTCYVQSVEFWILDPLLLCTEMAPRSFRFVECDVLSVMHLASAQCKMRAERVFPYSTLAIL